MTKPVVCVYMGQAAVVFLTEYNLYSGQFSSCCPVILFNKDTNRAGYYHMPGKKDLQGHASIENFDPRDERIVDEMAEVVEPTNVWIFPGLSIASVVGAQKKMQAAFNAGPLARNFSNVLLDIPDTATGSLGVSLDDEGKIKFSQSLPHYTSSTWYDSKRDVNNRPDGQKVLFWKWRTQKVNQFITLS